VAVQQLVDEGMVVETESFKWVGNLGVIMIHLCLGYEELACMHQILVTSVLHFGDLMGRECTVQTNSLV
jgi:hypothetical protein